MNNDKLPGYDQLLHDHLTEWREMDRQGLETQLFERWLYEYYTPRLQEAQARITELEAALRDVERVLPKQYGETSGGWGWLMHAHSIIMRVLGGRE